jgi:acetoin utilization deacetylase AcuC-like enzyme
MINVFYMPEQTANVKVFSPSPRKPALVVDAWLKQFPDRLKINSFGPVTEAQISAVHDAKYVHGVLNGTRSNGFGTKDMVVANSLPYTSGSMLAAAKHALEYGVAVSPTSGFHHSEHGGTYKGKPSGSGAQGFCTFNGLCVTAVALLNEGLVTKVGIADCDMHYGNGTSNIISVLGLKEKIKHFTAGANYHNESQASTFLKRLPLIIKAMGDCDILLYQAGADPWINDPLGGWLSKDQLRERDCIVFETCKEMEVSVVFNLAGGYSSNFQDVLDIHIATMEEAIRVFD